METRNQNRTKKCEICGRELPISDFSKSYRNRCKVCVAEQGREQRKNGKLMKPFIDWESRRYEIAKAMLPSCVCEFSSMDDGRLEKGAEYAVQCADALIAELQKGGQG